MTDYDSNKMSIDTVVRDKFVNQEELGEWLAVNPKRYRERKFKNFRSREQKGAPESESSREREGQGVKGSGSERARVLLTDLLLGANWPGSKKAVNQILNSSMSWQDN